MPPLLLGLTGRNNKDMARCDFVVEILKELRTEMMQAAPYFLLETDEAKIVSTHVLYLELHI